MNLNHGRSIYDSLALPENWYKPDDSSYYHVQQWILIA